MKLIENIKRNSGLSALNKSLKTTKRNKFVHNLVTARKIAILGIVTTPNDFEEIISFQRFLTDKNIQVETLVYYPGKEIPPQLLMRKGVNIFNKNEVNWYGKPTNSYIERFCSQEFDILIDLSMDELFTIRWISTLSRSKFKVGAMGYTGNPYDLVISVEETKKQIPYLIEQMVHYLNLINNRFAQEQEELVNHNSEN